MLKDLKKPGKHLRLLATLGVIPTVLSIFSAACSEQEAAKTLAPVTDLTVPAASAIRVSDLSMDTAEVAPNQALTITANVANSSDLEEIYKAELRINDVLEAEKILTLPARGNETLCFSVCKCLPGSYKVSLGDRTGYFLVLGQNNETQTISQDAGETKWAIAPDFTAPDIISGKTVALNELKGSNVLLNFVNYGCSSHLNNIASSQLLVIRDVWNQRHDFMPVSISCGCCSPTELREFAADNDLAWAWILDSDDSIIQRYSDYLIANGFPTLVFLDRNQNVREVTGYCDFFSLKTKLDYR